MISVVNGYVCTSSCDAASARAGKDPNAPPGQSGKTDNKADKTSGLDGQPATVLSGALKDATAANVITPANSAAPSGANQSAIDLLA
jgi:hypothetical protein